MAQKEFIKYKYKLNYIDFLKMYLKDNLYDLERYLFLQTEPLELEVYFEEVLLSINQNFKIGGLTSFARQYYQETENLVETLLTEGGREFFKVQAMSNKDYLKKLITSYMDLIKCVREIQYRLLTKNRKEYIPITITVSSYILNRIATTYTEQFTDERILISEARHNPIVSETQIRDLHLNMSCMVGYTGDITNLRKNFKSIFTSKEIAKIEPTTAEDVKIYTADTLKCLEMYDSILDQDFKEELSKWLSGGVCRISLPYFNHPSRQLNSDWSYTKCKFPKDFEF